MTSSDTVAARPEVEPSAATARGWRGLRPGGQRPPAMRGMPYLTLALVLLGIALFRQFGPFGASNGGNADLYNTWLFYGVIVVGFYFVFGISGQFAFSQAVMAAIGGYTSAWATRVELLGTNSFFAGLVVGVVVTALVAMAFSFLMRRATEFYFAIGTLGLSSIILEILAQWTDFTNSSGDSTTGITRHPDLRDPDQRDGHQEVEAGAEGLPQPTRTGHRRVPRVLGLARRVRDRDADRDLAGALTRAARGDRRP